MTVIGRDAELRELEAALDGVVDGRIGIRIEGPAGIGKSTLWQAGVDGARRRGWRVLVARPTASESSLTLGTLADLLGSIDAAAFLGLPTPQRRALEIALLRVDAPASSTPPVEGRVLGTAVRNLLAAVASERPIAIAIDDVQWVDRGSAAALAFAIRRLDREPVALVLARRTPLGLPFDAGELLPAERWTIIEAGPMPLGSLNELLRSKGRSVPSRPTLVRIAQTSGGNPLFALEIARTLESAGEPPAGEHLPVPADVRELLRDRLATTPASAREVLLDLAVLGTADAGRLAAVAGRSVDDELARAAEDGLISRDGPVIGFSHPLYAAAALAAVRPEERRAAHARAAATAASPEERARHAALASDQPDPGIAALLDDAAGDARRRGAPLASAELLRLAIERTPAADPGGLARRRLALGEELKRAGDSAGAIRELEAVTEASDPIVRARARLALAAIRYETDPSTAPAVALAKAALADAAGDPGLEAHAYAVLGSVDWEDLRHHDLYAAAGEQKLAAVEHPDPLVEGMLLGIRCGADFRAGRPLDPATIDRALELERIAPAPAVADRFSASLGTWLKVLDRFDEARTWLEHTRQSAIDEGDDGSLPYALAHLPELEIWTGHWDRAEALAREHLALAESTGLEGQRVQALYNVAMVLAHRGEVDEARRTIALGLEVAEAAGDDWMVSGILPMLGLLELSLGDPAAAAAALDRGVELRNRLGALAPTRPWPDAIEALAASGDIRRARDLQAELERRLTQFDRPSIRAAAARSRGVLLAAEGRVEEARDVLERALELHAAAPIAFDRARTLLVLGQVRRRLRERGAARAAFEDARATFAGLGARVWTERAATELERTGLRHGTPDRLTETERRVAELAASGMTNREVAGALFISPKTVDANLGRAYAKLGIHSRAELGAVIGPRRDGAGSYKHG